MDDSKLPEPMVPPHVDLRSFEYMPLHVRRLRDSDFGAEATGDEFRVAIFLWCAAWHQIPAGSLPDSDKAMAKLVGCGLSEWNQLKNGATKGFVKCSDGRLYHPLLSEIAMNSWDKKNKQKDRTKNATEAKKRKSEEEFRNEERLYGERYDDRDEVRYEERYGQRDDIRNVVCNEERNDGVQSVVSLQRNVHQLEVKDEKLLAVASDSERLISGDRGGAGGGIQSAAAPIARRRPPGSMATPELPRVAPAEKRKRKLETSLPIDFGISDRVKAWAAEKGFNRLAERLEYFTGYAAAKGARYVDWDQAFMNSIRDDWAKLNGWKGNGAGPPKPERGILTLGDNEVT